ncbi:CDP-alcohol phosphatidyltransferase family protein [bacterium]|nr:MAG: CDP-alcohol phosphatidyltransferase family protein [bacterium]
MRRPIAARNATWAHTTAKTLAGWGVAPNTVSIASVVFALGALVCLAGAGRVEAQWPAFWLFLGAALCVQLRLLCNLFDGMIAVEFKRASKLGPIFNDFPDRPADLFILVGCGLAGGPTWLPTLGWAAGALALLTAYVRLLGVSVGANEHFAGPLAKQQRMALVTIASTVAAVETMFGWQHYAMTVALIVIVVGCIITVAHRLKLIGADLSGTPTAGTEAE